MLRLCRVHALALCELCFTGAHTPAGNPHGDMTDVIEKAVIAQPVDPKVAHRDPQDYAGRFTFYTFVVILAGATTGLLLGYDNGSFPPDFNMHNAHSPPCSQGL